MNTISTFVLVVWPIVGLVTFLAVRSRCQAIVGYLIAGWLVVPIEELVVAGLPDLDKAFVCCASVLVPSILFDSHLWTRFRFRLIDVPIVIWCLCTVASSLSNDLGIYDGLSACLVRVVTWLAPYLLARLYICSPKDLSLIHI